MPWFRGIVYIICIIWSLKIEKKNWRIENLWLSLWACSTSFSSNSCRMIFFQISENNSCMIFYANQPVVLGNEWIVACVGEMHGDTLWTQSSQNDIPPQLNALLQPCYTARRKEDYEWIRCFRPPSPSTGTGILNMKMSFPVNVIFMPNYNP